MGNTNLTLSVDEVTANRARERVSAMGKSLNQAVRDYLRHLAGEEEDVESDIEEFKRLSGQGDSNGWKFNRDELHERR